MNTNTPNENGSPVVDKYAILEKLDSLENHERECWKVLSEELPSKCLASYTNGKLDAYGGLKARILRGEFDFQDDPEEIPDDVIADFLDDEEDYYDDGDI